ncbi:MAG: hypothetical protein WDW36_003298 [Sanguina aurantia]
MLRSFLKICVPDMLLLHPFVNLFAGDDEYSAEDETSIQTSAVRPTSLSSMRPVGSLAAAAATAAVLRGSGQKAKLGSPFNDRRLSPSASALSEPNSSADSLTRSLTDTVSKDSSIFSVPAPSSTVFELAGKSSASTTRSSILRPMPAGSGQSLQQPLRLPSISRLASFSSLPGANSSQDLTQVSQQALTTLRSGRLARGTLAMVAHRSSSQSEACHSVCSSTASSSLLSASTCRLDVVNTSLVHDPHGLSPPASVTVASRPNEAVREGEEVAKQFADAFLRALLSGDKKWGSDPALSALLHENARMVTHDQQLFSGKTAIIRRLNQGMEQFLRLIGQEESKAASDTVAAATVAALRAQASGISHTLSIHTQDPLDKQSGGSAGGGSALNRVSAMLSHAAAAFMPGGQAWRSAATAGACGPKATPLAGGSRVVVATYTFRMGMRRFKLQDFFTIRDGCIRRLRRSRG